MVSISHDCHKITTSVVHLYVNGKLMTSTKLKYPYVSTVRIFRLVFLFYLFLFLDNLSPLHLNSQQTTPLWVSLHKFRREINQGIFLASLVRSISLANPFLRQFSLRSTTSGPRISTILSTLLKTALDPGSLFILFYFFFLLFFFEK